MAFSTASRSLTACCSSTVARCGGVAATGSGKPRAVRSACNSSIIVRSFNMLAWRLACSSSLGLLEVAVGGSAGERGMRLSSFGASLPTGSMQSASTVVASGIVSMFGSAIAVSLPEAAAAGAALLEEVEASIAFGQISLISSSSVSRPDPSAWL